MSKRNSCYKILVTEISPHAILKAELSETTRRVVVGSFGFVLEIMWSISRATTQIPLKPLVYF